MLNCMSHLPLDEIRKKYPKAGMLWGKDEDEALKKAYVDFKSSNEIDFDEFVKTLTERFGRAAGGIKSRLARYFDDIPDFNYERIKLREARQQKIADDFFDQDKDLLLLNSYRQYVDLKQEIYSVFLRRITKLFNGVNRPTIARRLKRLIGNIVKYNRGDVDEDADLNSQNDSPEIFSQHDFSSNPEALEALRIMRETGDFLFLTGEAGTGKSTLLKYFRQTTNKNVAILAPTGVAALNIQGQTVHSFCGFGPDITLQKVKKFARTSNKFQLLQKLQTIVIDEISMVRADLLDCVDKFLRINGPVPDKPFGGMQMVFIGDLHQLPPVDKDFQDGEGLIKLYRSPYFFDALSYKKAKFSHIQLRQIYRQRDSVFIEVLNAVRNNAITQDHLQILNGRSHGPGAKFAFEQFSVYLSPHNARVNQINNFFIEKLPTELKTYCGAASGSFQNREVPADLNLNVKVGAQVMMLNNDYKKRWINGTMGKVIRIEAGKSDKSEGMEDEDEFNDERFGKTGRGDSAICDRIVIELESGEIVSVFPHTWEMFRFVLDKRTQKIDSRVVGNYTQYPFKLAWAVTIHKAQGKTFDKVYVDLSTGTFAHGQLYVALSRCRSLEGLYLKRPITPNDIIVDQRVVKFLESLRPFYTANKDIR